jgi:hypothetical protein
LHRTENKTEQQGGRKDEKQKPATALLTERGAAQVDHEESIACKRNAPSANQSK